MNFSKIFINWCWSKRWKQKENALQLSYVNQEHKVLACAHIHKETRIHEMTAKKNHAHEKMGMNMNFKQFKKLNYVTFYRHTFSYNLKLQLIIYDVGECLFPYSLCIFGSNICWNALIHHFFSCYLKCSPMHLDLHHTKHMHVTLFSTLQMYASLFPSHTHK